MNTNTAIDKLISKLSRPQFDAIANGVTGQLCEVRVPMSTWRALQRNGIVAQGHGNTLTVEGCKVQAIIQDIPNLMHADALKMNDLALPTARSLANLINQTAELLPREVAQRELIEHCPAGWALAQRIVNGEVSGAVVRYSQDWWLLDETADIASALLTGRAEGQIERAQIEAFAMNDTARVIETISAEDFLEIGKAIQANNRIAALEAIWQLAPAVSREFLFDFAHGEAIKQHAEMFPAGDPVTVDVDGVHHVLMIELPDQAARPVLVGEIVIDKDGDTFRVEGAERMGNRPARMFGTWLSIAGVPQRFQERTAQDTGELGSLFLNLEFVPENA